MPPFKFKFTAHPQHDAEGFTVMDAKCRGCTPDEMCPRSGHCERYESPLRDIYGIAAEYINQQPINLAAHRAIRSIDALVASYGQPVKLSEMTDAELNEVHSDWLRRGRAE